MLVGDWGLGIGNMAQSRILNPQSPYIIIMKLILLIFLILIILNNKLRK